MPAVNIFQQRAVECGVPAVLCTVQHQQNFTPHLRQSQDCMTESPADTLRKTHVQEDKAHHKDKAPFLHPFTYLYTPLLYRFF